MSEFSMSYYFEKEGSAVTIYDEKGRKREYVVSKEIVEMLGEENESSKIFFLFEKKEKASDAELIALYNHDTGMLFTVYLNENEKLQKESIPAFELGQLYRRFCQWIVEANLRFDNIMRRRQPVMLQ